MRPFGEREQADRVLRTAPCDVREHLTEEFHDRPFTERLNFRRQTGGQIQAGELAADIAAAGPALRIVDPDVLGHSPVRLIPEDVVGSRLDGRVGPLLAERAVHRVVETSGRDATSVIEYLAGLRVKGHPAALGLTAERTADAPGAHLHLEPELVRSRDDLSHRPAVVGEVVLREGVQHRRVPAPGDVLEIAAGMTGNADAEVRDARARHAGSATSAAATTGRSRRCESSATSR